MTESPDSPESPEIEEVRRLLADARHTEPMPDDVVARMDDAIAGLRETSADPSTSSRAARQDNVVPLAAHRRRRTAGMLVAAAAIVVGGVVVAQNLPQSGSSSGSASGADGSVAQNDGRQPPKAPKSAGANTFSLGENRRDLPAPVLKGGRLVVHPQRFSLDALAGRTLLKRRLATADSSRVPGPLDSCSSVPTGNGTLIRATYQNAPAALVYSRASGGSQVVDLYVCGTAKPVRSATLPAP